MFNKGVMVPQEEIAKFGHRPDMKNVSVFETMAQSRHHVMRKKNEVTIFRQYVSSMTRIFFY
jgi:hypothetical protein